MFIAQIVQRYNFRLRLHVVFRHLRRIDFFGLFGFHTNKPFQTLELRIGFRSRGTKILTKFIFFFVLFIHIQIKIDI